MYGGDKMSKVSIGRKITEKMKDGGFSPEELTSNEIQRFVEQITYEQKISWGEMTETGVVESYKGEVDFSEKDAALFIYQLLGEEPVIKMSAELFSKCNEGHQYIPGVAPLITRRVTKDNIVSFDVSFPELDYINDNILDVSNPTYAKMFEKVILPYMKNVQQQGYTPHEIPSNIMDAMGEIFDDVNKTHPRGDLDKDCLVEYTLKNIFKLSNSVEVSKTLDIVEKTAKFEGKPFEEVLDTYLKGKLEKDKNVTKNLEGFLNGVTGQIYMNNYDQTDFTPEKLKERMQTAFRIYTAHESDNKNFETNDAGYRKSVVRIGKGSIGMWPSGNAIESAMERFIAEVSLTTISADKVSEGEYLKRVAVLHSRFIAIHPFPESNGRIGRNIMNMMLSQKGKNFVLPKESKEEYLNHLADTQRKTVMELGYAKHSKDRYSLDPAIQQKVYDSGFWEYMRKLTDRPDKETKREMEYAGPLAKFVDKCNTLLLDENVKATKKSLETRLKNLVKKVKEGIGLGDEI